MGMSLKKEKDVVVLSLEGNVLGNLQIEELKEMLEDVLESLESKNNKVVVNLGNVDYIDSSGLGFLLIINAKLKKIDSKLVFANVRDKVKEIFLLTKINEFFKVFDSLDEALTYYN